LTLGRLPDAIRAYGEAFRLDPARLNITNINREYGFTLAANGEQEKAEQVFSALAANPDARASALDSLALLDLLYGHYAKAKRRLAEALSLAEQRHEVFLTARNHFFLAAAADGEGNNREQMKELDAALADFKNLGPKVEYASLVGQEFARAGAIAKAEKIEKLITPLPEPHTDEQTGYLLLLQGEIALANGDAAEAAKLFDLQDPHYGSSVNAISNEALARAYGKGGGSDEAIVWYEKLLARGLCRLRSWEPQQRCQPARVALAGDYLARGDKQKAGAALAPLLKDWQDADANLPLKKQALELESRLSN
jgi:tetratricopeptide (TPR) repeat protein